MGRTVILGLDGFHTDLLQFTPRIKELYESHPSAELESTVPPVTAPAWAAFQTGKNQGKHGIFDFVTYSDDFSVSLLDGRSLNSVTIYEMLSAAGFSCYLQNLPFSLPPRIDGDVMPSWLDGDDASPQPPDLCKRFGVEEPRYPALGGTDFEDVHEMQEAFTHNKEIFLSVLGEREHDFLFQLVSVTDWLQHTAYEDLVETPDSEVAKAAKTLLTEVDNYVKEVLDELDDEDDLVLLSDHGFQLFDDSFFVNDWLAEAGYLEQSRDGVTFGDKSEEIQEKDEINVGILGQWLRQHPVLLETVKPVKRLFERTTGIEVKAETGIDLSESVAYCQSKDEAAIRLNNTVDDDEAKKREITREIDEIDGITPYLDSAVYSGPHIEAGGDIVLTSDEYKIARGPRGEVYPGNNIAYHGQYGLLIGIGPSFRHRLDEPHLMDIAPTVLHQFGLAIPEDIDGQVLTEWLRNDEDPSYCSPDQYSSVLGGVDESDNDGVEKRLENLGYL